MAREIAWRRRRQLLQSALVVRTAPALHAQLHERTFVSHRLPMPALLRGRELEKVRYPKCVAHGVPYTGITQSRRELGRIRSPGAPSFGEAASQQPEYNPGRAHPRVQVHRSRSFERALVARPA
jgi:hypothetical protein